MEQWIWESGKDGGLGGVEGTEAVVRMHHMREENRKRKQTSIESNFNDPPNL